MPPVGGWILDYGLNGLLLVIAAVGWWWAFEQTKLRDAERKERDIEARAAAEKLYDQRVLNVKAESALEFRDFTIADLQRDLERCEQRLTTLPEAAS